VRFRKIIKYLKRLCSVGSEPRHKPEKSRIRNTSVSTPVQYRPLYYCTHHNRKKYHVSDTNRTHTTFIPTISSLKNMKLWIKNIYFWHQWAGYLSQYSVWLWDGRSDDRGSIPGRSERIFSSSPVSRPALEPTQPPVQGVPGVLSPGLKCGRGVTLTTHLHLVPRSIMSRSYTCLLSPERLCGV
jgi:hypothetical protein